MPRQQKSTQPTIHNLPKAFLECRRSHIWFEVDDPMTHGLKYKNSATVHRVVDQCERCTGLRHQVWSRLTGDILFTTYSMPRGYSMVKGEGTKRNVRMEYMRRQGISVGPRKVNSRAKKTSK